MDRTIFRPLEYFKNFKNSVLAHDWKSGEIILELYQFENLQTVEEQIDYLFKEESVTVLNQEFEIQSIDKKSMLQSINFGLSTKINYTSVGKEFSETDRNKFSWGFIDFFDNPKFFTIDSPIYKKVSIEDEFFEQGGGIISDARKIGIFWINDIY